MRRILERLEVMDRRSHSSASHKSRNSSGRTNENSERSVGVEIEMIGEGD